MTEPELHDLLDSLPPTDPALAQAVQDATKIAFSYWDARPSFLDVLKALNGDSSCST